MDVTSSADRPQIYSELVQATINCACCRTGYHPTEGADEVACGVEAIKMLCISEIRDSNNPGGWCWTIPLARLMNLPIVNCTKLCPIHMSENALVDNAVAKSPFVWDLGNQSRKHKDKSTKLDSANKLTFHWLPKIFKLRNSTSKKTTASIFCPVPVLPIFVPWRHSLFSQMMKEQLRLV